MWLLDANMDVHLLRVLEDYGHTCEATTRRGWQSLSNGDLVGRAVDAGFTCLLTHDRTFGEAAGRALKDHKTFAVVVVRLPQKPWRIYERDFRSAWSRWAIKPSPGKIVEWP